MFFKGLELCDIFVLGEVPNHKTHAEVCKIRTRSVQGALKRNALLSLCTCVQRPTITLASCKGLKLGGKEPGTTGSNSDP